MFRQTTYVGPGFYQPTINTRKLQPVDSQRHHHHPQQQQQQQADERQSVGGHGDGDSSAPLERRPPRRTNPSTVNTGPAGNSDTERPSSYQGDYQVTSYARPRILLIRSNTDRASQQVLQHVTYVQSWTC